MPVVHLGRCVTRSHKNSVSQRIEMNFVLRSKWSKMFNRCERLQVLTKIDLIMRNYKESEVLNWPLRRCKGQAPRVAQKSNVCENHAQISVWMDLETYDDLEPKFWGIDTWGVMPRAWGAGGTFQCARAQGQNSLNLSDTCINLLNLTSKNQESKEIQESKNLRIAKDTDSEEQSLKLLLRPSAQFSESKVRTQDSKTKTPESEQTMVNLDLGRFRDRFRIRFGGYNARLYGFRLSL